MVLATNVGADEMRRRLKGENQRARARFDVAILDEVAQSTEPACWVPMLLAKRVVLAGDQAAAAHDKVSSGGARAAGTNDF